MSATLGPGALAGVTVQVSIAWGADLTAAAGTWTWTDITSDVRQTPGLATALGRGDEAGASQPARLTLQLDNRDGTYSLGGAGTNWPNVRQGTPVRVRVDPGDGGGFRVLFQGNADGFTPAWQDGPGGALPVVDLSASGTLRRLQQGASPVLSTFRRWAVGLPNLVAYWPMEEGSSATQLDNYVGGTDLVWNSGSPKPGQTTRIPSTASLVDVGDARMYAYVPPYAAGSAIQFRALVEFPDASDPLDDGDVLMHIHTTGTLGRVDITYEISGGTSRWGAFFYDAAGVVFDSVIFGSGGAGADPDGFAGRMSLEMTQTGSDVAFRLGRKDYRAGSSLFNSDRTLTSRTVGTITQIEINTQTNASGFKIGHVTIENAVSSLFDGTNVLSGFEGEAATGATGRVVRLCSENAIPLTRYPATTGVTTIPSTETMGPQRTGTVVDLMRDAETMDYGQLWDGRGAGLQLTTRRYREEGNRGLTLDAAAGDLAAPFEPVHDDQRVRNRAVVTRDGGSTAVAQDLTGPMGSNTIGLYDTSATINTRYDSFATQWAGWAVNLGTVEGYRYPSVTVDMLAAPELAADVLDLVPGDHVRIANPGAVLGAFAAEDIDLIVEGIAHRLGAGRWVVTLTCSAARPWQLGVLDDESGTVPEDVFRLETDGATVTTTTPRNSTTLSVTTASGPLWTTSAADFPLPLDVGGVRVVATACSGASSPQTFTVAPLALDRVAGLPVKLWAQRPLGL